MNSQSVLSTLYEKGLTSLVSDAQTLVVFPYISRMERLLKFLGFIKRVGIGRTNDQGMLQELV